MLLGFVIVYIINYLYTDDACEIFPNRLFTACLVSLTPLFVYLFTPLIFLINNKKLLKILFFILIQQYVFFFVLLIIIFFLLKSIFVQCDFPNLKVTFPNLLNFFVLYPLPWYLNFLKFHFILTLNILKVLLIFLFLIWFFIKWVLLLKFIKNLS